jgi:hypothetical protein
VCFREKGSLTDAIGQEHLLIAMRELLNSILQFRDAVDTLYNYSLLEAARLDSSRDHERVSIAFSWNL